ncbi:MAG: pentapeptide repeat-containing protein [Candidatus Hydrogenedentes bacterium]|nr:pentapeptide repeat-containing protein [Candidatus Hydrogenedentota bacterium]
MKSLLDKYKWECITAAVCGALCLVMLAPLLSGRLGRWWPFGGLGNDGRVVIYRTVTGDPLMSGKNTRDAVENGLKRVREGVSAVSKAEAPLANFTALSSEMTDESPETVGRVYRLVKTFYGADLRGVALQGVDFSGINLQHADFTNADLSGARFDGATMAGASFVGADLSAAQFGDRPDNVPQEHWPAAGNAPGARFLNCDFEGDTLSGRLSGTNFGSANLRAATFRVWQCEQMDFSAADLSGGLIEFWPEAVPGALPDWDTQRFYRTVIYDDKTRVEGLRLSGVTDPTIPFVQWALAHGAVLVDPAPAAEASPVAGESAAPDTSPSDQ